MAALKRINKEYKDMKREVVSRGLYSFCDKRTDRVVHHVHYFPSSSLSFLIGQGIIKIDPTFYHNAAAYVGTPVRLHGKS